jgi:putative FmdB family regulatory protein
MVTGSEGGMVAGSEGMGGGRRWYPPEPPGALGTLGLGVPAIFSEAMPIYEYRCKKGHQFEVMQRINDDPVTKCEVCGAEVQRVFHPIAVHFKGSGFYNTDYGTRKRSREMKEAKESSSSKSESSSSSSDSKSSSNSDGGSSSSSKSSDSGSSKKSESKASSSKS